MAQRSHARKKLDPSLRPAAPFQVRNVVGHGTDGDYISRHEAEFILREKMLEAGIPLNSITARCMFEPTKPINGEHNICQFGRTPLWANEFGLYQRKALRSEFMEMLQRLVGSGHAHQKAARAASWG
jgi:hypothetical protein